MPDGHMVMTTTAPDIEVGRALAASLLDAGLVACVQLLPMESHFVWQGARTEEAEVLVVIKTRTELYDAVAGAIRARHPYEIPEILALRVERGLPAYLGWIDEVTATSSRWSPDPGR
jgi:periplasmic divalent cation tolerance protein